MTPFWLMILISVAGVPLASSLTNILKRRNLPPLLSAYCLLKIVQITVEINIGHSFITTVQGIQENLINNSENNTLNFALVFTNYSDNFHEAEGGIGKIFLSIFQSPSFAFHETSLLTNIFLSVGILLFSPYLYIYSLEGAALAYFTSLSLGLDTSSQARLQYCLAGMLTNSCLDKLPNALWICKNWWKGLYSFLSTKFQRLIPSNCQMVSTSPQDLGFSS